MTIDEIKNEISTFTGIPVELLTGETAEETIARAKDLLAYKQEEQSEAEVTPTGTPKEQFSAWISAKMGIEMPHVEPEPKITGYPQVRDAGEVDLGDTRSAKEKFMEWIQEKMAFNPRRHRGNTW